MTQGDDRTLIRLVTDDVDLLIPALLQRGASLRLAGPRRVDVRGMTAADIARVAAWHNSRVDDLETVHPSEP